MYLSTEGYPLRWNPATKKNEYEHRMIIEDVLGKPLKKEWRTHHVDEDKTNNDHSNIVLCENHSYHRMLHRRMKALRATGNPNMVRCSLCGEWKEQKLISGNRISGWCKKCHNASQKRGEYE